MAIKSRGVKWKKNFTNPLPQIKKFTSNKFPVYLAKLSYDRLMHLSKK